VGVTPAAATVAWRGTASDDASLRANAANSLASSREHRLHSCRPGPVAVVGSTAQRRDLAAVTQDDAARVSKTSAVASAEQLSGLPVHSSACSTG
jgi:hypothetical protein